MDYYIIIPAHNEEAYLSKTLQSLVTQSLLPKKIVVVNDGSTDNTQSIIDLFSSKYPFIETVRIHSKSTHVPGSKIVNAFNEGLKTLDTNYDIICKFDADLIFPEDYLEKTTVAFQKNPNNGMVGGFCYIEKNNAWVIENLTNIDHIRGALKAYKKECFVQIGGLKNTMGWDTMDELLAQYHSWNVYTDKTLHVKHLKPTGASYSKTSKYLQGEAFYKMRYGRLLTGIASAKLALNKRSFSYFINCLQGYFKASQRKVSFMVSEKEGAFIRSHRWNGIKRKVM